MDLKREEGVMEDRKERRIRYYLRKTCAKKLKSRLDKCVDQMKYSEGL
jgi:hypothetical protein